MRTYIDKLNGGTIFIKNDDKEQLLFKGYRDYANQLLIDSETRFPTASAGKFFVAIGIMKLIEDNRLTLDSTIGDILSIDLHQIDRNVTVYELLTHTSGVPNYFNEDILSDYSELWEDYPNYKIRSSKDLLPLFINKEMQYPRGERFAYNDSGFVLLGLIIEALTNQSFDVYLDNIIFKPLNMLNTGYYELDRLPKNCANAYIYDDKTKTYYTNIYSVDVKGTGAGGAFTNALDIHKLWNGLFNYKILNKKSVSELIKKQVDLGGYGYGLGVWIDEQDIPYFVGEDPGVTFFSWYNIHKKQMLTIISNYRDDVFTISMDIKKALANQ
ncbi:MAG: serine hydrolase [Tenericutes bacterium]|jgi:CubicO group peptidase (beta-lactamase class C family)|nr:serine hydrolase [Mycoplasmatota bacterium]